MRSCWLVQHDIAKLTNSEQKRMAESDQKCVFWCDVVIGKAKALSSCLFGEGYLKNTLILTGASGH